MTAVTTRKVAMESPRTTNPPPVAYRMANRSCQPCKLRKRKCPRELPECHLCVRGRRPCSYQPTKHIENEQLPISETNNSVVVSQQRLRNNFPVAVFLDPTVSCYSASLATPRCRLPIPPKVTDFLGDANSKKVLAAEYFRTAHHWMPIISRIRFYGSLMDPLRHADPDMVSILLGMKLILSCPEEADLCSEVYIMTKEFQLHLEMAGYVSIYTIQSSVLIALYEIGHGIFPGAFITVSTCARYATALGITGTLPLQPKSWVEQEERNRIWWAILILDRTMNLSLKGGHLCMPDPSETSLLPIDDDAWDRGILPNNQPQTLLSTSGLQNGSYTRLAQAVNLLSRVFRHISSSDDALRIDLDIITQLEKTLFALEHLTSCEELESQVICCCSIATCYSAILLLRTTYLSESHQNLTEDGKEESHRSIRTVSVKAMGIIQSFRDGNRGTLDDFPPIALDWIYRSAIAHISLGYDTRSAEVDQEILELKGALEQVSHRWRVANYYLQLLETRQAVKIPW